MITNAFRSLLITTTLACLISSKAQATDYHFIEQGSGSHLATLTTDDSDPFDHTNVIDLSFTAAGDAVYGFGVGSYAGTFDITEDGSNPAQVASDGSGGLKGIGAGVTTADMKDGWPDDAGGVPPTPSDVAPNDGLESFWISFGEPANSDLLLYTDFNPNSQVFSIGNWQLASLNAVPEPSTFALAAISLFSLGMFDRRRRTR